MHHLVVIIAKYFIIFPVLIALVVWLSLNTKDKRNFIILGICGGILTLVLAKIGSALFYNPRPFVVGHFTPYFYHGNDNGFPSDHTLFSSLLAFVILNYNRKWGFVALGIACLIGLSRVIAGVHHMVDIVGALLFALAGVYASQLALKHLNKAAGSSTNRFSDESHGKDLDSNTK